MQMEDSAGPSGARGTIHTNAPGGVMLAHNANVVSSTGIKNEAAAARRKASLGQGTRAGLQRALELTKASAAVAAGAASRLPKYDKRTTFEVRAASLEYEAKHQLAQARTLHLKPILITAHKHSPVF
jgi:hypothetical protein